MKRSLFISVISLALTAAFAFGQNTIKVVSATGDPGASVTVKVTATSDKNIAGASFTVNFDKAKLQIASTAAGADASSMTPVGVEVASANSDGSLEVSLVDFTFSNPVAAGTDKEVYAVTFTIAAGAAAGDIPVTLTDVSLSDESAGDIVVTVADGAVTVAGAEPEPEPEPTGDNAFWITDGEGEAGSDVAVKLMVTTDKNVAGASFTVNFDKAKLQIASTAAGADAASMTPVGVEVSSANGDGSLEVSLVDFTFSNPIAAGASKEVYAITFTIVAGTAAGDVALSLTDVSLSDESAGEITVELTDGMVTVTGGQVTPPTPPTDKNVVYALPVEGTAGQTASVKIGINTLSEIAGASFTIVFDPSLIQLTSAVQTGAAASMTPVGLEIAAANADGTLEVSLVDFTFSNPIAVGQGEIMELQFSFQSAGTATFQLTDISMSDPDAGDVAFEEWTPTPTGNEALAAADLPRASALTQNSPNPFNPSTTISYSVRGSGVATAQVSLKVYNLRGQLVRTLVDEVKPAGSYTVHWDGHSDNGSQVASGVYFYRMKTQDFVQTRKMVLLK
ncbi:MAG: T9SS type A sorting domain-containing protein [Candidatus Glassbacteria bacterium]|nr:T9SS type A sorting domain-containing protein [Candidatus Glassbacteria bacterium]